MLYTVLAGLWLPYFSSFHMLRHRHACTHKHTCVHTCTHTHIHLHTHTQFHTLLHKKDSQRQMLSQYTYNYAFLFVDVSHTHTHTHTHTNTHTHKCAHTHTHTHTCTGVPGTKQIYTQTATAIMTGGAPQVTTAVNATLLLLKLRCWWNKTIHLHQTATVFHGRWGIIGDNSNQCYTAVTKHTGVRETEQYIYIQMATAFMVGEVPQVTTAISATLQQQKHWC